MVKYKYLITKKQAERTYDRNDPREPPKQHYTNCKGHDAPGRNSRNGIVVCVPWDDGSDVHEDSLLELGIENVTKLVYTNCIQEHVDGIFEACAFSCEFLIVVPSRAGWPWLENGMR